MKNLFILPIFLVLSFSCTKKSGTTEPQLPPLTTEGKNVMGCKLNGAVHIYSGKRSFSNPNGVNYDNLVERVVIYADNSNYTDAVNISIIKGFGLVVDIPYYFASETSGNYAQYLPSSANFITGSNSGWIRFVRLDTEVAAGTFEFTAYHNDDSVKITEGRFDISRP